MVSTSSKTRHPKAGLNRKKVVVATVGLGIIASLLGISRWADARFSRSTPPALLPTGQVVNLVGTWEGEYGSVWHIRSDGTVRFRSKSRPKQGVGTERWHYENGNFMLSGSSTFDVTLELFGMGEYRPVFKLTQPSEDVFELYNPDNRTTLVYRRATDVAVETAP